jgi:hypothetical protein
LAPQNSPPKWTKTAVFLALYGDILRSRSARLRRSVSPRRTNRFLLNLFGRVTYYDDLVACLQSGNRGIVETAQRLVADHRYHPFPIDFTW